MKPQKIGPLLSPWLVKAIDSFEAETKTENLPIPEQGAAKENPSNANYAAEITEIREEIDAIYEKVNELIETVNLLIPKQKRPRR